MKRLIKSYQYKKFYYDDEIRWIYMNPSTEFNYLLEKFGGVRGMFLPDGTMYVWTPEVIHRKLKEYAPDCGIDVDNGCRFSYDPGWGIDIDINRRFDFDGTIKFLQDYKTYVDKLPGVQGMEIHLWGIEGKGRGPFDYSYDQIFNNNLEQTAKKK